MINNDKRFFRLYRFDGIDYSSSFIMSLDVNKNTSTMYCKLKRQGFIISRRVLSFVLQKKLRTNAYGVVLSTKNINILRAMQPIRKKIGDYLYYKHIIS